MLEKLLLTRTTGMFVEVTPSMSVSEEPETPGALATFWIVNPAENPVTTYDFHATALYLLGLDHENSLTSLASARENPSGNLLT